MNCENLKERALNLYRPKTNKNQNKIIKEFNKKFGCTINKNDIRIDAEDTVNFIFDGFEIMGMNSFNSIHFHFSTETFVRYNTIETIEDLGYFIDKYIVNQSKTTVNISKSYINDEDYINLNRKNKYEWFGFYLNIFSDKINYINLNGKNK